MRFGKTQGYILTPLLTSSTAGSSSRACVRLLGTRAWASTFAATPAARALSFLWHFRLVRRSNYICPCMLVHTMDDILTCTNFLLGKVDRASPDRISRRARLFAVRRAGGPSRMRISDPRFWAQVLPGTATTIVHTTYTVCTYTHTHGATLDIRTPRTTNSRKRRPRCLVALRQCPPPRRCCGGDAAPPRPGEPQSLPPSRTFRLLKRSTSRTSVFRICFTAGRIDAVRAYDMFRPAYDFLCRPPAHIPHVRLSP